MLRLTFVMTNGIGETSFVVELVAEFRDDTGLIIY